MPSPALSAYTHSMLLHCCCMYWLKSDRWPTFPDTRGAGGIDHGDPGAAEGDVDGESGEDGTARGRPACGV